MLQTREKTATASIRNARLKKFFKGYDKFKNQAEEGGCLPISDFGHVNIEAIDKQGGVKEICVSAPYDSYLEYILLKNKRMYKYFDRYSITNNMIYCYFKF